MSTRSGKATGKKAAAPRAAARTSAQPKSPASTRGSSPGRASAAGAAAAARFLPPRRRNLPGTARRPAAERIGPILAGLDATYPDAGCALDHRNALQLLVSTILSAQCTDERVNIVTRDLFQHYRSAADYAAADPKRLEEEIHSTGFFRNKAKSLIGAGKALLERHGGVVPRTMEEMLALPGVARKTANVVLGTAYGIASGVVVDTHVGRLAQRLGLSRHQDPAKIEADLMALVPRERWILISHQLILHGRRVCGARKPDCAACPLRAHCPSADAAH